MARRILSTKDQKNLLKVCERNLKYRVIVLLMLDAGLRVTEVVRLKLLAIDLVDDMVTVESLKKRENSKKNRSIPMTDRLRSALVDYINSLKNQTGSSFLFPSSMSDTGHLSRRAVSKWIKLASGRQFTPHSLRHTFATRVVSSTKDIRAAQDLLGHEDQRTTELYCHRTPEQRRVAISKIDKKPFYKKLFKSRRSNDIVSIDYDSVHCHVGRRKELKKLNELFEDKVNVLLIGPQGVGKSHLLGRFSGENILKLDDFKMVKTTLKNLCTEIGKRIVTDEVGITDHENVITKGSVQRLIDFLITTTKKDEYTLMIDDVTDITKTGVRAIERLKNHFHIVMCAREVKIAYASMITNFEKLEVKPLSRIESYDLITQMSAPLAPRIKDFFIFRDHVYEQSNGIPLFISEVIDRLAKKKHIDISTVREVKHTSALKEIDMSLVLVLCLSSLMILRYLGPEVGDSGAFRLFGGVFLLFALFARPLLMATKRKFI